MLLRVLPVHCYNRYIRFPDPPPRAQSARLNTELFVSRRCCPGLLLLISLFTLKQGVQRGSALNCIPGVMGILSAGAGAYGACSKRSLPLRVLVAYLLLSVLAALFGVGYILAEKEVATHLLPQPFSTI
jgi:hypothetical protein